MQHLVPIILLFYFPLSTGSLTLNAQSNYHTFVNTFYPGGIEAFEDHIQGHLHYPNRSLQKCEVGKAIVEVEFGSSPKIKNVSFLNPLSKSLNLAIVEALQSTNERWHSKVSNEIFTMSFAFKIGDEMDISGDILTSGIQLFAPGVPCRSDQTIIDLLQERMTKQQYRKALDYSLELIRRSPDDDGYQKIYRTIMDKLL